MALVLPNSVFMRIMKTGSQWSWDALNNAGLIVAKVGSHHCGLNTVRRDARCQNKFLFAAVRNPVTWYISRWTAPPHRQRLARGSVRRFDARGREIIDFNKWLNRVFDERPSGYLYPYYTKYLGSNGNALDCICRQENLTEDLIKALRQAGEKFKPADIRNTQPRNKGIDKYRRLAYYDRSTLQRLFKIERPAFEILEYSTSIQDYEKYLK